MMKTWECECGLKISYTERPGGYILDTDVVTVDAQSIRSDVPGHTFGKCMGRFVAFGSLHQN